METYMETLFVCLFECDTLGVEPVKPMVDIYIFCRDRTQVNNLPQNRKFNHHLHTFMLFQTFMTSFLLRNTNQDKECED